MCFGHDERSSVQFLWVRMGPHVAPGRAPQRRSPAHIASRQHLHSLSSPPYACFTHPPCHSIDFKRMKSSASPEKKQKRGRQGKEGCCCDDNSQRRESAHARFPHPSQCETGCAVALSPSLPILPHTGLLSSRACRTDAHRKRQALICRAAFTMSCGEAEGSVKRRETETEFAEREANKKETRAQESSLYGTTNVKGRRTHRKRFRRKSESTDVEQTEQRPPVRSNTSRRLDINGNH